MLNPIQARCISWLFGGFALLVSAGCSQKSAQPKPLSPGAEGAAAIRRFGQSGEFSVAKGGGADGQMVDLSYSSLTDAELSSLLKLEVFQELVHLYIAHSKVTDQGLEHLTRQTRLQQLSLRGNDISDAGVHLSAIKSLTMLDLYKTNITDQGLACLESLSSLRHLDVRRTGVTKEGVERLRRAIPECLILSFESAGESKSLDGHNQSLKPSGD